MVKLFFCFGKVKLETLFIILTIINFLSEASQLSSLITSAIRGGGNHFDATKYPFLDPKKLNLLAKFSSKEFIYPKLFFSSIYFILNIISASIFFKKSSFYTRFHQTFFFLHLGLCILVFAVVTLFLVAGLLLGVGILSSGSSEGKALMAALIGFAGAFILIILAVLSLGIHWNYSIYKAIAKHFSEKQQNPAVNFDDLKNQGKPQPYPSASAPFNQQVPNSTYSQTPLPQAYLPNHSPPSANNYFPHYAPGLAQQQN